MRAVKVGLDYGTSASKIIFWDDLSAGKPKAFVVQAGDEIRLSSSIAWTGEDLVFGYSRGDARLPSDTVWYESVKMRVAGEVAEAHKQFCYGGTPPPPPNLTFKDLAILTLWFLRSKTSAVISKHLSVAEADLRVSAIVGIPRHFYEDASLTRTFLEIAMGARRLHDTSHFGGDRITIAEAKQALSSLGDTNTGNQDPRDWIRSEAEAAMFWPVRSPEIKDGPYAEIDIGAGTTNASVVGIWPNWQNQRWIKTNLGFYGAYSLSVGMDAVDLAISQILKAPPRDALRYRGQERELLRTIPPSRMAPVYREVYESYKRAWMRAYSRLNSAELTTFPGHDLFIAGGGSTLPGLRDFLASHGDREQRIRELEPPPDLFYLDGKPVRRSDLLFLLVAYGLSFGTGEIPDEYDCRPQPPRPFKARGLGDMYDK